MLNSIQGLRAVAAVMIVLLHSLTRTSWVFPDHHIERLHFLETGVDIFFVISGYIMTMIVRPETTPVDFWLRRVFRIGPSYWVATLAAFAGAVLAPQLFFGQVSPWAFAKSLLFLPADIGRGQVGPVLPVGWTLLHEFAFYSLMSICLLAGRAYIAFTVLASMTLMVAGSLLRPYSLIATFFTAGHMMIEFALGMVLCVLLRDTDIRPKIGLTLAGIGFALICAAHEAPFNMTRSLKFGIPAMLIVAGTVASEPLWRGSFAHTMKMLGDASYSIYLWHLLAITPVARLLREDNTLVAAVPSYVFTACLVILGVSIGLLSYHWFEKPMLRLSKSWLGRPNKAGAGKTSGGAARLLWDGRAAEVSRGFKSG